MSDSLLLKVSNLGKRFPGVVAQENVSLSIKSGEVHALLGENGAGKSTLLKILAGAQYQDSGTIDFDGKPLGRSCPTSASGSASRRSTRSSHSCRTSLWPKTFSSVESR